MHEGQALVECEGKSDQKSEHRKQIEEAISWYNKVLGFRIECGHGVKFIFTNINPENPSEEYFFIIRHEEERYSLLDCRPRLDNTEELISELNKTNGLFKFVRIMREKFQEAAARGISHRLTSLSHDSSMISPSAPVASSVTDGISESPSSEKGIRTGTLSSQSRKIGKGQAVQSPGSASSLRRSSRIKGKK